MVAGQSYAKTERTDRARRAYELSLAGNSLRAVSDLMKAEGYRQVSHATVRTLISEHTREILLPLAAEHVKRQYERLEEARIRMTEVMERAKAIADRFHVTVSYGQVMVDEYGEKLRDDGPEMDALKILMAAEAQLLRTEERIAKLFGTDAPAQQTVTVVNTTETDQAIRALTDQIEAANGVQSSTPAS